MKNYNSKEVKTRKDEIRLTTSNPKEMHGKYLVRRLFRTWQEDFADEDTGEVVSIERNEVIMDAGKYIDGDVLVRIQFHIETGDITEVEVSNQLRDATLISGYRGAWSVTAEVDGKNRKFLLYADSIRSALEIAQDYIELNFRGFFDFVQVKTFDSCIFLDDFIVNPPERDHREGDFYKIEVEVLTEDDFTRHYIFVLQTKDVDSGMIIINDWITKKMREMAKNKEIDEAEFSATVKSGTVIPCYRIIEKEFSDAYINNDDENRI